MIAELTKDIAARARSALNVAPMCSALVPTATPVLMPQQSSGLRVY